MTGTSDSWLRITAPAKVNLYLEVLGRRPDGFHELETLMVAIDLTDTLDFMLAESLSMSCTDATLSTGPANLVVKAAEKLKSINSCRKGASIHLTKRIPMEAGLGGGSSDAAATLVGLNKLWNLGLTQQQLQSIAGELGSDVAFFIEPSAAWCTGRGEVTHPTQLKQTLHFVLICPTSGLSTAEVYRGVKLPDEPRSSATMRAAMSDGDSEAIGRAMFNRLEESAEGALPQLGQIRSIIQNHESLGCLMSGSGSTIFALCADPQRAEGLARRLKQELVGENSPRVFVVRSYDPE